MNKFFTQEDGLVLALSALVLPVMLLIGALMIDGGQLYIRHGEVEHLSRQSGQSGLLALSEIIIAQATQNYNAQCNVLLPPSRCGSNNLFDFLSETDLNNLIFNIPHQNRVTQNTLDFALEFDPRQQLQDSDLTVTFPHLYSPGDNQVRILVAVDTTPTLLLGSVFPHNNAIKYQSIAYLPLQ